MTETVARDPGRQELPIPPDLIAALVARAARAPSVHNTQPWRFRATPQWLVRDEIQARLALPGNPQMLLQFGHSHTAAATARRPAADVLD